SAEGHYVVDASHAGVGKVEVPIRISVRRGLVTRVDGGAEAGALSELLAGIEDERAYNVAEFGIGCNDHAKLSGATIEDEKVLGTCHLALGSNIYFGGSVQVSVHLDGVLRAPTVFFDGEKVLEGGRLLV
ncbi:aminopeptidase, partial [Candidatus Parcubacteria bacterium]